MKKAILKQFVSLCAAVAYLFILITKWFRVPYVMDKIRQRVWSHLLLSMGDNSKIMKGAVIHGAENLSIGNSVVVGNNCHMWANGGLTIGDDSLLAAHCTLTTLTHDPDGFRYRETLLSESIIIGKNVWLGYGVVVMPGVTIGDNAIIGAGAVVTHDIPMNAIAVGVPARVVRQR